VLGDLYFHLLHFHFDLLGLHGSGLGGGGLRLSGSGDLRGGLGLLNGSLLDLGQLGLLLLGNGLGLFLGDGGGLFGLLLVLSALLTLLGILGLRLGLQQVAGVPVRLHAAEAVGVVGAAPGIGPDADAAVVLVDAGLGGLGLLGLLLAPV